MPKLIIQIPCYNEAESLPVTLSEIPRKVSGFDDVEWLVVDDGSTDKTIEVARAHGVDHVVSFPVNRGLAKAFVAGIEEACKLGADVIVNTDADNQYRSSGIQKLVEPILNNEADMVIGARPIEATQEFSWLKKKLQKFGSWVVRKLSNTDVADAPSGFRAFSRETALRLNVFSPYTYTLETIIQAGLSGLRIKSVPVETNAQLRESRLVKSVSSYVRKSIIAMIGIFIIHRPVKTFAYLGMVPFFFGSMLVLRWVFFFSDQKASNIPSLIFAAISILLACQIWVLALVGHLMAVNRRLLEDIRAKTLTTFWDKKTTEVD